MGGGGSGEVVKWKMMVTRKENRGLPSPNPARLQVKSISPTLICPCLSIVHHEWEAWSLTLTFHTFGRSSIASLTEV